MEYDNLSILCKIRAIGDGNMTAELLRVATYRYLATTRTISRHLFE